MADVFISYAHEDRHVVRELAHSLTNTGFSVWWDREIAVGADLVQVIESKLETCKAVIVLWSAASVRSTWVISEANVGLDAGRLIPVHIDGSSIPLPFRMSETADLRGWPTENRELELQKLQLAVRSLVTGEAISEDDARTSNDRLDPTVSVRIANRVTEALQQAQPSGEAESLALRLDLETSMANFALVILNGEATPGLLADFIENLEPLLRTSYINIWYQSNQIYGWDARGLDLADRLTQQGTLFLGEETPGADNDDYLASTRLKWAFVASSQQVYLSVGSMYSASPPLQVLNRLEQVCELIARYESRVERATPEGNNA